MKKTYNILMKNGETHTVEGTVVGQWGIDKRQINLDGRQTLSFFLTHIPTGLLVTNARTQKRLLELANQPDMIDETDIYKLQKATKRYYDEHGWKD